MAKIIIGIHGLGNKPPGRLLETWWRCAILDGLRAIDRTRLRIHFELVYWADIFNPQPLDPRITDAAHPLFVDEPYPSDGIPPSDKGNTLGRKIWDYSEKQLDRLLLNDDLSLNFSSITDRLIQRYFGSLEAYYTTVLQVPGKGPVPAKLMIRERLSSILHKHQENDILLLAHSMGSIIAYDVLSRSTTDVDIDTLVTLGSPLGIPVVVGKIFSEQKGLKAEITSVRAPDCILRHWYNFSDIDDKVAFDHTLGDDYGENRRHVRAEDMLVHNTYAWQGKRNPHKSYGYLKTLELASILDRFLSGSSFSMAKRLKYGINRHIHDVLKGRRPSQG